MSKNELRKKKRLSLGFALIFTVAIFFTGCGFGKEEGEKGKGSATKRIGGVLDFSKKRLAEEDFFSKNSPLVFIFDQSNTGEKDRLESLIGKFPTPPGGKTLKESIMGKLQELGFDYENEIEPILGQNAKVFISFEKVFASSGKENVNKEGVVIAAKIKDSSKFGAFKEKISENEGVKKEAFKESEIVFSEGDFNFAFIDHKKFLIFADTAETIREAVNRSEVEEENLKGNKDYKDSLKKLSQTGFLTLYVSPQKMAEFGSGSSALMKQNEDFSKMTESIVVSFLAKENGIEITGSATGNKDIMQKLDIYFDSIPNQKNYLFEKVPGKNTIFFMEGFNLKKKIDLLMQGFYSTKEEAEISTKAFSKMVKMQLGIELENDLFTWLDKGFAIEVGSAKPNLVPMISVLIDAEGNPESARKFSSKIASTLEEVSDMFNSNLVSPTSEPTEDDKPAEESEKNENEGGSEGEKGDEDKEAAGDEGDKKDTEGDSGDENKKEGDVDKNVDGEGNEAEDKEKKLDSLVKTKKKEKKIIEISKSKMGKAEITIVKIMLDNIPNMNILKIPPENIEISFGVTDDNVFFISTLPDFANHYAKGALVDNALFKNMYKDAPKENGGVSYFEMNGVTSYLDILLDIATAVSDVSAEQISSLEEFKNYISPLKGGIFSSENSKYESELSGFISIDSSSASTEEED